MSTIANDRAVVRELARQWMQWACEPVMAHRKRQWTALKDLKAERPMVLFETWTLLGYVSDEELLCHDPTLRSIEYGMRHTLRQLEEVGDDLVVEPCWRVGWDVRGTGYGVDTPAHHARDAEGGDVAYRYDHPIRTPADIDRLTPRKWHVHRQETLEWRDRLQDLFGDIIPVEVHGTEGMHAGLTGDLFRLVGNDNLLTWVYDQPDAIHRIMAYLRDDRLAHYRWLEHEGLLGLNNHWTFIGSGSPGLVSDLPRPGYAGQARLQDLWVWMESQETTCISPGMFSDFFLPYMASVSDLFGMVYYGCCEPVHDRWDRIVAAMPQTRAVSISPWCDMRAIAEALGRSCVFSRKPRPAPISGSSADWEALAADLDETLDAARECNLEFIYRDVYRIGGERTRLRRWVEMARDRIG